MYYNVSLKSVFVVVNVYIEPVISFTNVLINILDFACILNFVTMFAIRSAEKLYG